MNRWLSAASLLVSAALAPPPAQAGSSIPVSVEDRGEKVAILVAGARTGAARPENRGDRLELPLDQALPAIELKLEDPTVRKVELRTQPPSLRVQLRHGSESTRLAAELAELSQQGDTLEILLPREPRAFARALNARAASDPTMVAAAAPSETDRAPAAAPSPTQVTPPTPAPVIANPKPPALPPEPPRPPVPGSATTGADPAASALAPAPPAAGSSALDLDRPAGGSGSPLGTMVAFGALAGLVALGWMWFRRKHASAGLQRPLEILAQVPVGPRARVVWLSAGRREMVISVSEKDVRVLGQWMADGSRAGATSGELPEPQAAEERAEARPTRLPSARLRKNPSLTGLLRLRDQHAESDAGHDAAPASGVDGEGSAEDSEWARQLVAATRRGAIR